MSSKKLSELRPGQSGTITKMSLTGSPRQRMMAMGFVKNEPVKVIRKAPLGDPIELEVKNYKLSLRKSEAALIEVEVIHDAT
ncbi:MAG: ferrous iron transport protein A [Anaerolineaceae bacterium]|nr:ferrous iron transport protein A [Anaerolineaceae bacterium]